MNKLTVIFLLASLGLTGCTQEQTIGGDNAQSENGGGLNDGTTNNNAITARPGANTAKQEALKLLGDTGLTIAPQPTSLTRAECPGCEANKGAEGACANTLIGGLSWAEKLPAAFPVYPNSEVLSAAGADTKSCAIRTTKFITPVTMPDAVNFYYSRALNHGYSPEYAVRDGDHIVGGVRANDNHAFAIYFAPANGGGTEVSIVANAD